MFSVLNYINDYRKEGIYERYCILVKKHKSYDSVTRKQMINEIFKFYNENKEEILLLFTQQELEFLFSLETNKIYPAKSSIHIITLIKFYILSFDEYHDNFSITKELSETINELKIEYKKHKNIIEKKKENAYFIVGLLRTFGALTIKELIHMYNRFNIENNNTIMSLYTSRFIGLTQYNDIDYLSLSEILVYSDEIIESHPKNLRVKYSLEQLISIGKNYYAIENPEYKRLYKYPNIINFITKNNNDLIIWRGMGLCTEWFKYSFEEFITSLTNDEKAAFFTFLDFLPSYILEKNDKNILSEEDGILFYKVFMPFLEYAAFYYNLDFDHFDNSYNVHDAYKIFDACSLDKFSIVDNYIKDTNNLPSEHKEILYGLKKFIKGAFTVYKHTKDGSLFYDGKSFYLVKGIQTHLEHMDQLKQTPCICMTMLIPFKDKITYNGLIAPMGTLGPNITKQVNDEYRKKKYNIIKKL